MLLGFVHRWMSGATQICNRITVGPPLLLSAYENGLLAMTSSLLLTLLIGALVLLNRRLRGAQFATSSSTDAHDRSAFHAYRSSHEHFSI